MCARGWERAPFTRVQKKCGGLTPPMNLMNKPLNVMFLHCPHLQLHPFIPSYGRRLSGTIDIFPGTEQARAHRRITSPITARPPPPRTSPPPLVKMNNKPTTYTIQRGCILLLAERPCLPFSPGVLCSHCLTEWLIWLNFPSQTSQVHSLFREHPPPESLREERRAARAARRCRRCLRKTRGA